MLLVPQLLPVELRAAMTRDHVGPSDCARVYGYATELYESDMPPIQMSVFVLWFEVRGFEGSKADTLGAMRWREPGCELGDAIVVVGLRKASFRLIGSKQKQLFLVQ